MKSFKKLAVALAISSIVSSLSYAQCSMSGGSTDCSNLTFSSEVFQNAGDVILSGKTTLEGNGIIFISAGYTENGNSTNNTMDISGELSNTKSSIYLYAAETKNGDATGNKLNFSDWKASQARLWGAYSGANASNNTVIMNSGEVEGVIGAFATKNVIGNRVDINGGTVGAEGVTGGESGNDGDTTNNTVNINGGNITDSIIIGGYTEDGKASGNEVNINNKVKALVIGGDSIGGEASGNIVNIAGEISAVPNHDIWAETDYPDKNIAVIGGYTGTGKAINNTVNFLSGQVNGTIYGGFSLGDDDNNNVSKDVLAGNTLNIGTADKAAPMNSLKAGNIFNFENINFYLPSDVKNGDVALELNPVASGVSETKTDLSKSTVSAYLENATGLTKDSKINLIKTDGTLTKPKATNTDNVKVDIAGLMNVQANIALDDSQKLLQLGFDSSNNSNAIAQANPNAKLILEAQLVGAGMLNQANDLVIDSLEVGEGKNAFGFVGMNGYDKRLKTGSHIDVKGFNFNVGAGSNYQLGSGNMNSGIFVESGKGNWDSHLDTGKKGSGKSNYVGGGIYSKYTAQSGFYGEGVLRGGKVKTKSDKGVYDKYQISSGYFGASVGVGQKVQAGNNELDFYGKYSYLHTGKDNFQISGVDVSVGSVNSSRAKLGVKDKIKFDENNAIYAGLAYQYAFDGKTNGDLYAVGQTAEMVSPKLKGSTGIAELGYKYNSNKLDFSIGAQGYAGKERGFGADTKVKYNFK